MIEDDYDAELGTLAEDMLGKTIELITGKTITDPARIAASGIPSNLYPIFDERLAQKQNMYFELN